MLEAHDIAVVIPCYNHASVLRRTLNALQEQTHQPKEVIIIDDASEDEPEAIVKEFQLNFHLGFTRLRHNHGAPFARNEGARLTTSKYLLFLDADAELVPEALALFQKALIQHPEVDIVYSNFFWGSKLFRGQLFDLHALQKRNFIHTSSLLRRSAFLGFDESLKKFQDWDLWLTMAERGSRGLWIDQALFRVEPRRTGMSHWLPAFTHRLPWPILGWMPTEIRKYREAEAVIRKKHRL